MLTGFIDDGYTEQGYITAIPRLFPEMKFTYRPLSRDELAAFHAQHKNADDKAHVKGINAILAKKITEWSLTNSHGDAVPVSAEVMGKLKPELSRRLWEIVFGSGVSDEMPGSAEADAKN